MRPATWLTLAMLVLTPPANIAVAGGSEFLTSVDPGGCLLEHVAVEPGIAHYQYDGLSSDGSSLILAWERGENDRGAFVLNLASGDRNALPAFNNVASFSPDDRTAVGAAYAEDGKTEIVEADILSGDFEYVVPHPDWDWLPSYSSDGRTILFNSYRTGASDIYTYDRQTQLPKRLTTSDKYEAHAQFSPDDRLILFHRNDGDGDYNLYVLSTEDGRISQLTTEASEESYASWSPDGSVIVFASDRYQESGVTDLFLMNADGSDVRRLTHAAAKDAYPFFAPAGDYVYFTSYREPQGVYRIALDRDLNCVRARNNRD